VWMLYFALSIVPFPPQFNFNDQIKMMQYIYNLWAPVFVGSFELPAAKLTCFELPAKLTCDNNLKPDWTLAKTCKFNAKQWEPDST
jgi:hypothetical protein